MPRDQRLNQVLAVEKGEKGRAESHLKIGYRNCQKPEFFDGFSKSYAPFVADDIDHPTEAKNVQLRAMDVLGETKTTLASLFDVTLTKDMANCTAKANVVVDGEIILENIPAVNLLFIEKQLLKVQAIFMAVPTLDQAVKWNFDEPTQLHRSEEVKTLRTKKVQKALQLLPQTEHQQGMAEMIVEDVQVGTYTQVRLSGALPVATKKAMVERLDKLVKAVKQAREQANMVEAPQQHAGAKLFTYLIG